MIARRFLIPIVLLALILWAGPVRAQDGQTQYTVQPGDTLSLIAGRFDVPVDLLAQANEITNPNLIQAGQVLVIPDAAQVQAHQEAAAAQAALAGMLPGMLNGAAQVNGALVDMLGFGSMRPLLAQMTFLASRNAALPLPFLTLIVPDAIVQGETDVVWVTALTPFVPTGAFQGRELVFIGDGRSEAGYRFFALLPTGALDKPGLKKLMVHIGPVATERNIQIKAGIYETQHIVLPPGKGGLLAPDKLKAERERLYALWGVVSGPPRWTEPFQFPIAEGFPRTSPYGTRRSYNGGPVSSFHAGSDWGAPEGTPILAPAPGVVALAEPLFVRGGAVIIDHGAGVYSNFWHMSQIDVKPGDVVKTGQQLGLVGTTGLSTGAHLHWEIRVNTLAVDPLQWTEQDFP